ncbi:MAG: hypothetical protein HY869_23770 [Chloroflexi bacterium]|nr:hypothetical protein [Chloroflexota bacterium]
MSLEDIFKVLADSRQQDGAGQSAEQDPLAQLVGGLLGGGQGGADQTTGQVMDLVGSLLGGQTSAPSTGASEQGAGLGNMMGLLESVIGAGQTGENAGAAAGDPLLSMLQPFINQLAEKVKIPPALATIAVTFVVHKMLAHHPTSGRDSTQFDLDDLLKTGALNADALKSSGMVSELSQATGLDEGSASQTLDAAFSLLGGTAQKAAAKPAAPKLGTATGRKIGRLSTD